MASAIPNHANYLEPLHIAIGEKSKTDKIDWDENLKVTIKKAQLSLKEAQTLTMPKAGDWNLCHSSPRD